jgi:hypothetical protein
MYIYKWTHIHRSISLRGHPPTHTNKYYNMLYIYINIYIYINMYKWTHIHKSISLQAHTHTHTNTHTHTHTNIHKSKPPDYDFVLFDVSCDEIHVHCILYVAHSPLETLLLNHDTHTHMRPSLEIYIYIYIYLRPHTLVA